MRAALIPQCPTFSQPRRAKEGVDTKPSAFALSSHGDLSVRNSDAAFQAEGVGFDLAADFLYSIVIPIELMTFQTGDIRNTSEKLAGAALGRAISDSASHAYYSSIDKRYSQAVQSSRSVLDNSLVVNLLGV